MADSGLPADDVRAGLKALLESHRGQLAVSDSGELLYEFDPRLIQRGTEPFTARLGRAVGRALTGAFKAWIVVMLVGYFVLFVVLVIAALFAQRGNDSRGGWSRGRRGGPVPIPNFWFWYWIWGPRWRIGRPYYGRRWERTLDGDDKVPFYKKVFAFVFGPDRPRPTQQQLDRSTLRLIRSRSGVLTTAELVEHTALGYDEAESEMARLLGAYDGEAVASPEGELVYAFPELTKTLHAHRRVRPPNPSWMRLEYPLELTGNTKGANAAIAGMNGFTLAAAATAPWFIFPRLGIGGPAAFLALVIVPVVFSVLFFGIPLVRAGVMKLENRRRARRNVRRVLLGMVYERSLGGDPGLTVAEARRFAAQRLKSVGPELSQVDVALQELAAEFGADVSPDPEGELVYTFPAISREMGASETVRRNLALSDRPLGEVIYSTADSPEEAGARDLRLFDRQLGADLDLSRYVPSTDRVDFEDDFELVTFDEELARR